MKTIKIPYSETSARSYQYYIFDSKTRALLQLENVLEMLLTIVDFITLYLKKRYEDIILLLLL